MEMKKHEVLEQRMCKELDMIEQKYIQNPNQEMSAQDLERMDKLYHALKSKATYDAMKEAEEYEQHGMSSNMMSGARERGMDGRYVSRAGGQSYSDGYSQGYADGASGHYPPPYYNEPRRW